MPGAKFMTKVLGFSGRLGASCSRQRRSARPERPLCSRSDIAINRKAGVRLQAANCVGRIIFNRARNARATIQTMHRVVRCIELIDVSQYRRFLGNDLVKAFVCGSLRLETWYDRKLGLLVGCMILAACGLPGGSRRCAAICEVCSAAVTYAFAEPVALKSSDSHGDDRDVSLAERL